MFDNDYTPLDLDEEDYMKNDDWEYCHFCGKPIPKEEYEENKGICTICLPKKEGGV